MIQVLQQGEYKLIQTAHQTKILALDKSLVFAWIYAKSIGEILVTTHKPLRIDHVLALGKYRLYRVMNEKNFTDLIHLELSVGEGVWQGYLLPNGLPADTRKRTAIIPTRETITFASAYPNPAP